MTEVVTISLKDALAAKGVIIHQKGRPRLFEDKMAPCHYCGKEYLFSKEAQAQMVRRKRTRHFCSRSCVVKQQHKDKKEKVSA